MHRPAGPLCFSLREGPPDGPSVPVLYLKASRDRLIPVDTAEQVMHFVKNGQIIELDGPHLLLQENSDSAARIVASFIEELKC